MSSQTHFVPLFSITFQNVSVLVYAPQRLRNETLKICWFCMCSHFSKYSLASFLSIVNFAKPSVLSNCLNVFLGPLPLSLPVHSLCECGLWIFAFHGGKVKKKDRQDNLRRVADFLFFQIKTTTIYFYPHFLTEFALWRPRRRSVAFVECVLIAALLPCWFQLRAMSWAPIMCSALRRPQGRIRLLPLLSGIPQRRWDKQLYRALTFVSTCP